MNFELIKTKTIELQKALLPCMDYYRNIHSYQEEVKNDTFTVDRLIVNELIRMLCYLKLNEPLDKFTLGVVAKLLNFIFDDLRFNQDSVIEMVSLRIEKDFKTDKGELKFPIVLKVVREYDFMKGTNLYDSVSGYLYQILNLIIKSDNTITPYEEKLLEQYSKIIYDQDFTSQSATALISSLKGIFDDFFYAPKHAPSNLSDAHQKHDVAKVTPIKKEETLSVVHSEEKKEASLEELLAEVNQLIGLENVKQEIGSLINMLKVETLRKAKGFPVPDKTLHLVFTGNPGTGKTTIARLLSRIYKSLGILEKGHLIEIDRSGLVAGYVGQTAIKTIEIAKSALGGILFIDEAYSLAEGGATDFGKEAINSILKFMEDNRENIVVIVAGYTGNMEEFIEKNPGLKSRFNKYIHFNDYKPEELLQIFEIFVSRSKLKLAEDSKVRLLEIFQKNYEAKDERFGNGRLARNFFEKVYACQANRLVKITDLTDEILCTLTIEDINQAFEEKI
ncbi:MAG: AAA family ATPase [Leptospiraceae bacterium]|nr:AAA family ATPase [Leptospiraceae bacterium]